MAGLGRFGERCLLVVIALLLATPGPVGPQVSPADPTRTDGGGFYGVARRDGRWWLTTPDGRSFFSAGVDFVNPGGMPARDGSNPYRARLQAQYGNPVGQTAWAVDAGARLRAWGVNTVGAFSSGAGGALAGLPDTPQLFPLQAGVVPAIRRGGDGHDAYPLVIVSPNDGWDFHRLFVDVYHPAVAAAVDQYMAAELPARANDPTLLGYFLDNELPVYYRHPDNELATNAAQPGALTLADSYIALGPDAAGKRAWAALLRRRYGDDIAALNTAWATAYDSFDAVLVVNVVPGTTPARRADKSAFLADIAETYFRMLRDSFRRYDSHHLILGCRFVALEGIDTPPEILRAAGEYQDVVSINYYIWATESFEQRRSRVEARYAAFARATGRPILNSEFSFGARDAGLPSTRPLGELVDTQAERAQRYSDFARITAGIPEAVGLHWWAYVDPPPQGALNGNEDGNYGLVSNADVPYAALTGEMAQINPQLGAIHAAAPPGGAFPDVAAGGEQAVAISELAARGIILGYVDGRFGPDEPVLRAQLAALIARTMGWEREAWGNPFPDQGPVDDALWRNVGTLARYGVARGYQDGTYGPTGEVLGAQVISLIARGMVARGYWRPQPDDPALLPGISPASGHRLDLATYVHYAGPIPGTVPGADWAEWDRPATRGWLAQALWQALDSYFPVP